MIMDFKTKNERRVRFADSVGLELASIFLFDLINIATIHRKAITYIKPSAALQAAVHHHQQQAAKNNNKSSTTTTAKTIHDNITTFNSKPPNNNSYYYNNNYNSYNNSKSAATTQQVQYATTNNSLSSSATQQAVTFNCEFIQPISLLSFKERVKVNKVHLETCQVNSSAGHISVTCTIRVLNCSYDKSVIVRYTTDDWRTHTDSLASYIPGSCDGWSDKFTSTFTIPSQQVKTFELSQRIIFAIRYACSDTSIHWDNNGSLNYAIKRVS